MHREIFEMHNFRGFVTNFMDDCILDDTSNRRFATLLAHSIESPEKWQVMAF